MRRLMKPDSLEAPLGASEPLPLFAPGGATPSPAGAGASPTGADVQGAPAGEVAPPAVAEESNAPAPTAHHPRGMSRWPALLACPLFEGREGDAEGYAAAGTGVHATLAWWLSELRERGRLPEVEAETLSFHEAGAWRAAKRVAELLLMYGVSPRELRVEERVTLFDPETRERVFGTADALFLAPGRGTAVVVDFKTFRNPGRDYLPQLAGYGVAAARASKAPIGALRLEVLYGDSAERETAELKREEAEALAARGLAATLGPRAGDAPRQCAWCELCARFAACPACVGVAEATAEAGKDGPGEDAEAAGIVERPDRWPALGAARKAQLLVIAEFATRWAEAVRDAAKADLRDGLAIADPEHGIAFGLRERKAGLRLDVDALWAAAKARGVSAADFRACLRPDAAEAKKVLRAAGLKAKEAEAALESCGTRGAPSLTLARL